MVAIPELYKASAILRPADLADQLLHDQVQTRNSRVLRIFSVLSILPLFIFGLMIGEARQQVLYGRLTTARLANICLVRGYT